MKIPTILGLALLITAVTLGVMVYAYNQQLLTKKKAIFAPKNILVVNIRDTQAAIIWQTDFPIEGRVIFGNNQNLNQTLQDDRDQTTPKNRLSHFITLKNLEPGSKYFFKLINGQFISPDKPLAFTTAPKNPATYFDSNNLPFPLRGVIVQTDLNPADDSLIVLTAPGSAPLATFSTSTGNFILPLINMRTSDLKNLYRFLDKIDSTLTISRGQLESKIDLKLPVEHEFLPPLPLGQNLDLKNYQPKPPSQTAQANHFDLNNDGRVNTLDLSILLQNIAKKTKDPMFDFNKDGTVDQKDADLLKVALQ